MINLSKSFHSLLYKNNFLASCWRNLRAKRFFKVYNLCRSEIAPPPAWVFIAVNRTCNLKCKMCDIGRNQTDGNLYSNLKSGTGDMEFEDLKTVINQFQGKGRLIAFNSTEPLIYPQIIDAVRYAKEKGLTSKISTNGFFLPQFSSDLVEAGLDILTVSIDGSEKIHDRIRGTKGCYRRLSQGIEEVNQYKKRKNVYFPFIGVNLTISEGNYNHLIEAVEEIEQLGVDKICLSHLNVVTRKMRDEHNKTIKYKTGIRSYISPKKINTDILYEQLETIRRKSKSIKVYELPKLNREQLGIYYKSPEVSLSLSKKCHYAWFSTQILVNGDVVPLMRCMNLVMGNVFTQNFDNIWNGQEYRTLRRTLNKHGVFPVCKRCCGTFKPILA